jgi:hypothetical protein
MIDAPGRTGFFPCANAIKHNLFQRGLPLKTLFSQKSALFYGESKDTDCPVSGVFVAIS